MKKIILVLSTLFFISIANAQEKTSSPHHIGLHAGSTSGVGFSYRYWPTQFGFQLTTIPIFNNDRSFISSGISLLCTLRENEKVDLYGYLGNHLLYTSNISYVFDPSTGGSKEVKNSNLSYNIGLGLGLKIKIWEVVNLNFQAGYGLYDVNNSLSTNIAGAIGLYYNL